MTRLAVLVFVGSLLGPVSLAAQIVPVNDFCGGVSVLTTPGADASDSARHTLIGWHASASQRIKKADEYSPGHDHSPLAFVGDFGGQFGTTADGSPLHVYEYLGGIRLRAGRMTTTPSGGKRVDPTSVFVHALYGVSHRRAGPTSETGFMMGYGGGVDVDLTSGPATAAYAFGVRTQFDWLPSRTNGAWANKQFRFAVGVVFMARYWD